MTVQELIDALNKVENKSKSILMNGEYVTVFNEYDTEVHLWENWENVTVQEFIDSLNKITDKLKPVLLYDENLAEPEKIYEIEENDYEINLW